MKSRLLEKVNQSDEKPVVWLRSCPSSSIVNLSVLTVFIYTSLFASLNPSLAAPFNERTSVSSSRKGKKIEDLPNFHKVHSYLYRGGEPSNGGVSKLKEMGVKTIIDLRAPTKLAKKEKAYAESLGLKYVNLPMSSEAPTSKQVDTLLNTIDQGKANNEPVFVHCQHGSDRAGCMIGIWRVTRDNWSFDETYKEMRKYWFGPKFYKLRNAVKERAKS